MLIPNIVIDIFLKINNQSYPEWPNGSKITSTTQVYTIIQSPFGTGNVLYDPATLDLTGVIDFGFSSLGDPAIDIAAPFTLGDTFFGFVQSTYPNVEPVMARARFYKGTFLLYEALYGLETGDQEIFQEAIAPYI